MTKRNQFLIIMENGIRSRKFFLRIHFLIVGIHFDPRGRACKSGILGIIPLHRCTCIVPALKSNHREKFSRIQMGFLSQFVESIDTLEIPELRQVLKRIIAHSEFFSLIYVRRSLHHVKEGGDTLCRTLPV